MIFVQGICASRVFHFSYLVLSFLLSNFFFSSDGKLLLTNCFYRTLVVDYQLHLKAQLFAKSAEKILLYNFSVFLDGYVADLLVFAN